MLSKGEHAAELRAAAATTRTTSRTRAYGAGATPEAIAAADAAKDEMRALKAVFVGPLKDNAGKEVIPAGTEHAPYDRLAGADDYLVEGVVGSIT